MKEILCSHFHNSVISNSKLITTLKGLSMGEQCNFINFDTIHPKLNGVMLGWSVVQIK